LKIQKHLKSFLKDPIAVTQESVFYPRSRYDVTTPRKRQLPQVFGHDAQDQRFEHFSLQFLCFVNSELFFIAMQ